MLGGENNLNVDVTFDHIINNARRGYTLCCADFIRSKCKDLYYLRPITLVLKKLLKNAGLNQTYYGNAQF